MNQIDEKTTELALLLRKSPEYAEFAACRDRAMADETTKILLGEYNKLQFRVQAASVAGSITEAELQKLQKLGELLQLNRLSSEYLFAKYKLNAVLTKIYHDLAEAIDIDLTMLDD